VSAATAVLGTFSRAAEAFDDPLPSWNNGAAKQAILTFVKDMTEKSSSKFVEPKDRIATFDQDGTLWTEHPFYGQAMFALDRLGKMAPQHPAWKETEAFKSVLTGDREAMAKFTEKDRVEIVAVTHSGMSSEDLRSLVATWLGVAKAPRFERPYTDLVYQPMLEVMTYLREKEYRTYIVTGGGQEFVPVYSEQVYGVPPEQVVGSSGVTTYVKFHRPAGDGARLMMLVHHNDATREYAYGPGQRSAGHPRRHFSRSADGRSQ